MTNEQPTCEQRIDAELQDRIAQFNAWQQGPEADEESDDPQLPDPLSIDKHITYNVLLSTGGPADGFRLTFDPESGDLIRGEYYFQDWFDGATRTLSDADADMIAEAYGIYVEPERYPSAHQQPQEQQQCP